MKRPDEIKKGLEWCTNDAFQCYDNCPYFNSLSNGVDCAQNLCSDALALIRQLEAENAELSGKIKQLERERDALLTIMKGYRECDFCKHGCPPEKEENLYDLCYGCDIENCRCRNCTTKNNCWEWRGPCEENGGSDA